MFSQNIPKIRITKTDNKYIVMDYIAEKTIEFEDIMDAKTAIMLMESGFQVEELTPSLIVSFRIQLLQCVKHKYLN